MPAHRRATWRWAGAVALGMVLLLAGAVAGRLTAPNGGEGLTGPSPSPEATPAPTAPHAPTAPTSPGATPDTTVTASGSPGQDVLAASGTGPQTLSVQARRPGWRVATTSRCTGADTFTLVVRSGNRVVARLQDTGGSGDVVVSDPGEHRLHIEGSCSWTVRATS